jgi:hypothetical protein
LRFFKVFVIIFLIFLVSFSSVFFTRSSVVTSLVNDYLTQYKSTLSCIDFSINANFDLVITKLCVDSPYAEIELTGILVEWYFKPSYLSIDKAIEAISQVTISSAEINAKADVLFAAEANKSSEKLSELPNDIRKLMHNIANYKVPLAINIEHFNYRPFVHSGNTDLVTDIAKKSYQGDFSVNNRNTSFSLTNTEKAEIFKFDLARTGTNFTVDTSTDLAKASVFLKLHQSAFLSALSAPINKILVSNTSIDGELISQLNWHNQVLGMSNSLRNFSLQSDKGFASIGSVKVDGNLAWQTDLVDENLIIDFSPSSVVNMSAEQEKLTAFISSQVENKTIKEIIIANPMNTLAIETVGPINVNFNTHSVSSTGIALTSENLTKPVVLSFNEIVLNYNKTSLSASFQEMKFNLKGEVNIAQLQPYNKQPIKVSFTGKITQEIDGWQVGLTEGTAIELSQLSLFESNTESLISHWQGEIAFVKATRQSQINTSSDIILNLQAHNQFRKLSVPKIIDVKSLVLETNLNGSLDDIMMHNKMIFDGIPIANITLTGDVYHPDILVSGKDVLLTDILTLKVKPPIPLKFIDGKFSYQLTGQLKDNDNLIDNPMLLALSVSDATGEIDGTWVQELNWQQHFSIKKDKIKSLTLDATGDNKAVNNLTIAKIETATEVSSLSAHTLIDFSQGEIHALAKNISGNLLDGHFHVDQMQWPFSKGSAANVTLTKIDLEKLLELDKKQGIVVTGKVSGNFPIYYEDSGFLVKKGSLHNVGDGLIQVYNNPAVEELKSSSTELKLAFSALENLHYHHLTSAVSMGEDGYMLLVTEIKGRNPDLDNEVNLNLNLSYDLLGLLESFNITEHFESKVIKGLQR